MPKTDNPLAQFFRQPAIYIRLPSGGRHWPKGSINIPANGEIPVLPMTAIDEITYRTPDALFNGESVVSVIRSCIPCIQDAWAVPAVDLDALLVAIRIASYGHNMDVDTRCPKCSEENTFGLDLRTVIDKLTSANYHEPVEAGDLQFHFRPLNYREMTNNSQIQFEQQKTMQVLNDADAPEESKVDQLNAMMKRLVTVTVTALAESISEIRTKDAIITEQEYIVEFLNNCDRGIFNRIRDHVIKLRESSELKPLNMRCPSCQHQYEQAFTLDMSRFFESAS